MTKVDKILQANGLPPSEEIVGKLVKADNYTSILTGIEIGCAIIGVEALRFYRGTSFEDIQLCKQIPYDKKTLRFKKKVDFEIISKKGCNCG